VAFNRIASVLAPGCGYSCVVEGPPSGPPADDPWSSSPSSVRTRSREEAARLERQLAAAQQIAHLGSWEWDLEAGTITWSDELYRIYGLEPGECEITLDGFLARLYPLDRARVRREVEAALAHGERFGWSERIVRPDGSVRHLDTLGEIARARDGRVRRLLGTCRDVTEVREREETIRLYAELVENVQLALTVWEVADPDDLSTIRLAAFNPAAERAARIPLGSRVGDAVRDLFPYAERGELERLLTSTARDRGVHEATVLRSRNPADPTRALAMKAFPLPGGRVGLVADDITEATRTRRLRDGEQRVLEMIASGAPLQDVLTELILSIEEHSPPTIGSILLLEGERIRHSAAPHMPEGFNRAIDGSPIGPAAGSCGTAAFLGRPVFARDIEHDARWADYRDLARAHGLSACWSYPVLATDGRVLGTFAFYYREPRGPTDDDVSLIARASHIAGIAIERRQLEDQLRALSAHVETIREDERTGISREIHDVLGQALTALKMDLAWTTRRLAAKPDAQSDAVSAKLQSMAAVTDDILHVVRRISAELRPGVLDDLGLFAAIEWQAGEFEKRTGSTCTVASDLEDARFDRDVSTAVFRIFQESLTNVTRHAKASRVDVRLSRRGDSLRLEVRDDGVGIGVRASKDPTSLGLLGMRERARRLGGEVVIERLAPHGTSVVVEVPFAPAARGAS
jgi:PAS domain S-box-containing protein